MATEAGPDARDRLLRDMGLDAASAVHAGDVTMGCDSDGSIASIAGVVVAAHSHAAAAAEIARAYDATDPDWPRRLRARDFAFVLLDERRRTIFAANDFASLAPLAYWTDGRALLVGSHVLLLLHHARVARAIDDGAIAHAVLGTAMPEPGTTAIRGVRRLLPGEAIVASEGTVRRIRYDGLRPRDDLAHATREECARAFWECLDGIVAERLDGRKASVSLSGGLDSPAVASAAAKRVDAIDCFSAVAPSIAGADERGAIEAFARALRAVRSHFVDVTDAAELPLDDGPLHDGPFVRPLSMLPARTKLWAAARATGCELLLDGEGGDELFSASASLRDALRSGEWAHALRYAWAQPARRSLAWRALVLPALPPLLRRAWTRRWERAPGIWPAWVRSEVTSRPPLSDAARAFVGAQVHDGYDRLLERWLSSPAIVGSAQAHRTLAARAGIALASPLLDRRMLELAISIPARWRLDPNHDKPFLRAACAGRLPDDLCLRPKDDTLSDRLAIEMLRSRGASRVLRDERVRARFDEWIRFDKVFALVDSIERGYRPHPRVAGQLQDLVALAWWYSRASREFGVD